MPVFSSGEKGFSLLELIIVVIIIGILATIGISQYYPAKERALDKEAKANLKLLQAAEKIYRMESSIYLSCTDTSCINTNLRLSLPSGSNRNWTYTVPTASANAFNAQAARNNPSASWSRTWSIDHDDEDAGCTGSSCPPP